ncbi:MAG: hypothetical protein M1816_006088 [Peltula sp. TS41687]|nr:MAG: hypothetical protein M1816_006088 [Peltula sp. TS41687]
MATTTSLSPPVSPVTAGPSTSTDGILSSQTAYNNLRSAAPVELDGSPVTPSHQSSSPMSSLEQPSERSRSDERAKAHAEKRKDPAVLVDIPQTPAAQDYEVAENTVNVNVDANVSAK